jgi:hypothetical protein
MSKPGFWDDAEVISTYTRRQAIEDGVLVDLMQDSTLSVCQQHYKYPIACTAAVFGIMQRAVENKRHCNDYAGILHDMLWMSTQYFRTVDETTRVFQVIIKGAARKSVYDFKMVCGPSDDGSPCMTIMQENED